MSAEYQKHFEQVKQTLESQGGSYGWFDPVLWTSIQGKVGTHRMDDTAVSAIFEATTNEYFHGTSKIIMTSQGAGVIRENGELHLTEDFGETILRQIEQHGLRR